MFNTLLENMEISVKFVIQICYPCFSIRTKDVSSNSKFGELSESKLKKTKLEGRIFWSRNIIFFHVIKMSSSGTVDILSMLNKAQAECNQQNSVAAFFKQIADKNINQTTSPSNNIDSLEQIERQLRPATQTNGESSRQLHLNWVGFHWNVYLLQAPVVQNANPLAQFFNSNNLNNGVRKPSPNQQTAAKEKPKTNGNNMNANSNRTGPPPGYKQQEKKLITPTMLLNSCKDKPAMQGPPAVVAQHPPLTKVQLIEAVRFLMETDEDFVTKVHDAYLKSVSSSSNGKKF